MISEEIRSLLRNSPFRPFTVHLADGKELLIHHHDYAWLLPSGYQLIFEDPAGKVHLVTVAQISEITYDSSGEQAPARAGA